MQQHKTHDHFPFLIQNLRGHVRDGATVRGSVKGHAVHAQDGIIRPSVLNVQLHTHSQERRMIREHWTTQKSHKNMSAIPQAGLTAVLS